MTEIINEPKIQNPLIVKFRELLNHHAFWLYLLTDEAEKRGLDPTGGRLPAITKCGISQGNGLVKKGGTKSLLGLKKALFTNAVRWVFEMDEGACCPAPLHFLTATRLFGWDESRHLIALSCRFCCSSFRLLFFGTH